MNIFTKWKLAINGWFRTRKANKHIARVNGRNPAETQLIRQAINHIRKSNPGAPWSDVDDLLVALNTRVVNGLQNIPLVAGVQSLQAPTGVIFRADPTDDTNETGITIESSVHLVEDAVTELRSMWSVLEKIDLADAIVKSISTRIVTAMFSNAHPTPVPAANEKGAESKAITQTIRLFESQYRPVTTIVVTSDAALAAVIAAAGETFHPQPIVLLPIRQVGVGFGGIAIIHAPGCAPADASDQALLTHINGSTLAAAIYSPFAPVVALPSTDGQLQLGTMDAIDVNSPISPPMLRTVKIV